MDDKTTSTLVNSSTCGNATSLGVETKTFLRKTNAMMKEPISSGDDDAGSEREGGSTATPLHNNAPEGPLSGDKDPAATAHKNVSFAPTPQNSRRELIAAKAAGEGKSTQELLEDLLEVREELSKASVDFSAERALRKKKEKSIIKLAKQLNCLSNEITEKQSEIEQLASVQVSFEAKLQTTQHELDELSSKYEHESRERHAEITAAQTKHREVCARYDARIADLNASNAKQAEELRQQLLASNLEADALRVKLARLEMDADPTKTNEIKQRAISSAARPAAVKEGISIKSFLRSYAGLALALACLSIFMIGYYRHYLSLNAICAPCIPGTELMDKPASYEAPWWAPPSTKAAAFGLVCGTRARTRVDWSGGNGAGRGKLLISDADAVARKGKSAILMESKKTSSAVVRSDRIVLMQISGKEESKVIPWRKNF